MQLSRVHHPVSVLGYGVRAGIWTQGCSIRCVGCVSADTWSESAGSGTSTAELAAWVLGLGPVDGVTISGGEPFDQPDELHELLLALRGQPRFRDGLADILVYSGYDEARLRRRHAPILELTDAVVAGPYVAARAGRLALRGSDNQRIVRLTPLGEARYPDDDRERRDVIQVDVHDGTAWLVGIPQAGFLDEVAKRLAARGVLGSWSADGAGGRA